MAVRIVFSIEISPFGCGFSALRGFFSNFPPKAKEKAQPPVIEKSRGSAFSTVIIPSFGGTK